MVPYVISVEGAELGSRAAQILRDLGRVEFGPGLTDAEFERIEAEFGIEFSDDHYGFLASGLPLRAAPGEAWPQKGWPDWRNGDPERLREQLNRPVEGVLFDVQANSFWHRTWGIRPADPEKAMAIARKRLARVPKMIPVYGHRYLPSKRGDYGHPVLSIYQSDAVIYGNDLADYIANECNGPQNMSDRSGWDRAALVPFWGSLRRP